MGTLGDCPSQLTGWATEGKGTTGGGNAPPKTITSLGELKSAADGSDPRVVVISGTISTGGSYVKIGGSNLTIRGEDKNAKIEGHVSISGNNIILQNFTVDGKNEGSTDAVNTSRATHIWFDHLNIINGADGILDLTNGSDHITVSWCKFWYTKKHGHRFALLFGNSSERCKDDGGKQNHTLHHNWFAELVDQRMPRMLFGKGHVYNNYYNSPGNSYCVRAGSWASVLVENNYFKDVKSPHQFGDANPAYIVARGNEYDNVSGRQEEGLDEGPAENACEKALPIPGPWEPDYPYKLDDAKAVPEIVMKCAGPQ